MVDPPVPPGIVDIVKVIAPYLAAGFTEEQLTPYLPILKKYVAALGPEQRAALAVYLKEKTPALADLVDKLLDPPPPGESPPPPPEEGGDLTEDEELKIARYTDLQLKEGNTIRSILATVNRVFRADMDFEDLQEIVDTFRVNETAKKRAVGLQTGLDSIRSLQAALQKEQEAHLATKQSTALRYIEYREGIVLRWGASLAGALGLGLAAGRFLR